jgi:hypothetical protein
MEPQVESATWDGPAYEYEDGGRKKRAVVPLTVELRTKQVEHWDVAVDRSPAHKSFAVKREHARLEGLGYRLFDREFIERNLVELRNRQSAYALLSNARDFDLRPLQGELLMDLSAGPSTMSRLQTVKARRPLHVRAAVLDLWRRRQVRLPMTHSFISDEWLVERVGHAG